MTSRCCWFTQPATATSTNCRGNDSGTITPRLPKASPGARCKGQDAATQALGLGVDRVFGQNEGAIEVVASVASGAVKGVFGVLSVTSVVPCMYPKARRYSSP